MRRLLGPLALLGLATACDANSEKVCSRDQKNCSGECVSILDDRRNCGACGLTCTSAETCVAGSCIDLQLALGGGGVDVNNLYKAVVFVKGQLFCSGTLVSSKHVLTAAHCVCSPAADGYFTKCSNTGEVLFYTVDAYEKPTFAAAYKRIYIPPEYKQHRQDPTCTDCALDLSRGDLAVIELDGCVSGITPMKLTPSKWPKGSIVAMVGFGASKDCDDKQLDQHRRIGISEITEYLDVDGVESDRLVTSSKIKDAAYTLRGDSGGPLLSFSKDYVIGVASLFNCPKKESHFTNVDRYRSWIAQTIGDATCLTCPASICATNNWVGGSHCVGDFLVSCQTGANGCVGISSVLPCALGCADGSCKMAPCETCTKLAGVCASKNLPANGEFFFAPVDPVKNPNGNAVYLATTNAPTGVHYIHPFPDMNCLTLLQTHPAKQGCYSYSILNKWPVVEAPMPCKDGSFVLHNKSIYRLKGGLLQPFCGSWSGSGFKNATTYEFEVAIPIDNSHWTGVVAKWPVGGGGIYPPGQKPPACGDPGYLCGKFTDACFTLDCGPCPACGDGSCVSGESCLSCPKDCGPCSAKCGDNTCEGGETCSSCPYDCGQCKKDAGPPDAGQKQDQKPKPDASPLDLAPKPDVLPKPDGPIKLDASSKSDIAHDSGADASCQAGATMVCFTGLPGVCNAGVRSCLAGSWGPCVSQIGPSAESCDGKDNDCDGKVDEDFPTLGQSCSVGIGECKSLGIVQCKADGSGVECSAKAGAPMAEICDGKDNDCDGLKDEDFPTLGQSCSVGVGECAATGIYQCRTDGLGVECPAQAGTPKAEVCDGKDNDCDGSKDEDFPTLGQACAVGIGECKAVGIYQCRTDGAGAECSAKAGTPAPEVCDNKDNNCNGVVDDGVQTTYYYDVDGDGFGDSNKSTMGCTAPPGYVGKNGDCDDTDVNVYPGAPEICDLKVNDCGATFGDIACGQHIRRWRECTSHHWQSFNAKDDMSCPPNMGSPEAGCGTCSRFVTTCSVTGTSMNTCWIDDGPESHKRFWTYAQPTGQAPPGGWLTLFHCYDGSTGIPGKNYYQTSSCPPGHDNAFPATLGSILKNPKNLPNASKTPAVELVQCCWQPGTGGPDCFLTLSKIECTNVSGTSNSLGYVWP